MRPDIFQPKATGQDGSGTGAINPSLNLFVIELVRTGQENLKTSFVCFQ